MEQPRHIMHLVLSGFAGGGMENGVVNLINRLSSSDYRFSICALDTHQTFSERIKSPSTKYFLQPKKDGFDWGLILRLTNLLRKERPDLVHSHNWGTLPYAALACKASGVPLLHGDHGRNQLGKDSAARVMAKKILGRLSAKVATVSQELASEWLAMGFPVEKVISIPNGVDASRFRPGRNPVSARRAFNLPEGFLLGTVGRMDALKDHSTLLDAFAAIAPTHRDLVLTFLGKGPEEPRLRARVEALGLSSRVIFLGHSPHPEEYLASIDIFVLPSLFEGMSNVVLEAMAAGVPVITADLSTHKQVFREGEEAVTFRAGSAESLAETLEKMIRSETLRKSIASNARSRIERDYSLETMVANYDALYRQVLDARMGGH